MKIAVCICTRRRPEGLQKLLLSINKIKLPENVDLVLVIVENDNKPVSEIIVKEFSKQSRFKVKYFLETNQGIAYARNRSIMEAGDCDFCSFVDDDQIVEPDWMIELVKCQLEFKADGVTGSTPPKFDYKVPSYIKKHHQDDVEPYGTVVSQAATGCLLIRKSLLDKIEGPFDLRLNFTGGEDFYLTYLISKNGGVIRSNPNAVSYEIIPENRATIRYVINRTVRTANTKYIVLSLIHEDLSKIKILPRNLLRLILGLIVLIPYILFSKNDKLLGLFKISYSLGSLMFILGRKNKFYS